MRLSSCVCRVTDNGSRTTQDIYADSLGHILLGHGLQEPETTSFDTQSCQCNPDTERRAEVLHMELDAYCSISKTPAERVDVGFLVAIVATRRSA